MPLRHRHAYAADFQRGLPTGDINRRRSSPHNAGAHRSPAQIRQVRAGVPLGSFTRRFLSYTSSSRSPDPHHLTVLARPGYMRGRLPPSPAPPGSGCPLASPPCYDRTAVKVSHLHSINQRLTAHAYAGTSPWPHFDQKLSLSTAMITRSRASYVSALDPSCPVKSEEPATRAPRPRCITGM